jgi:hypothetical protein
MKQPKKMVAKFPGTCNVCGKKFDAGTPINWMKGAGAWHDSDCLGDEEREDAVRMQEEQELEQIRFSEEQENRAGNYKPTDNPFPWHNVGEVYNEDLDTLGVINNEDDIETLMSL